MDPMNSAQLHLALTHLPVVGALLAAGTLSIGALTRVAATRRFGLALLLLAGALCLALVNVVVLGWVAHLGGEIRHDEIRLASRVGASKEAGEHRR